MLKCIFLKSYVTTFFCNFTFDCCSIYNPHTSCSCLHNTIIYVYSLILQMSFCFSTLRFINTVREHIIYKIHKIAFTPPHPPPSLHQCRYLILTHREVIFHAIYPKLCLFARGSIDWFKKHLYFIYRNKYNILWLTEFNLYTSNLHFQF